MDRSSAKFTKARLELALHCAREAMRSWGMAVHPTFLGAEQPNIGREQVMMKKAGLVEKFQEHSSSLFLHLTTKSEHTWGKISK